MLGSPTEHAPARTRLRAVADWLRQCRQSLNAERYDAGEMGRVSNDLGLSRRDLRTLARHQPDAADELGQLLEVLRIDAKALRTRDPATLRDMQRICIMCRQKTRCRRDVVTGAALERYRDYCPNVFSLDAMLQAVPERC